MSHGRKRNAGERYPSGRLKKPLSRPGAEVRRIVDLARRKAADPILGTPIGWLRLQDELTDALVSAAEIYANQRRAYDAVQGMPVRSARSADLGATPRSSGNRRLTDDERAIRAYERTYEGLFARLGYGVARQAIDVLDRVVISLQQPAWAEINTLKAGLMAVGETNGILGDPSKRSKVTSKGVSVYAVPINRPALDTE